MGFAGKRLKRKQPALAWGASRHCRARGRCQFLGDGVPIAAGVALALPATIGGAAVLAHVARFASGHISFFSFCDSAPNLSGLVDPLMAAPKMGEHLIADGAGGG